MHIGFWWERNPPRSRWEHNIKINLKNIGWGGREWLELAQDMSQWKALLNTVMNLSFGNFSS
jgi:hypothetical protein